MMAIDFIIGAFLLTSAMVNALALGAFWVTPGLRTTANRFVINLLIVNLVGCIVLVPSIFLCGNGDEICERHEYSTKVEKILNSTSTFESASSTSASSSSSSSSSTSIITGTQQHADAIWLSVQNDNNCNETEPCSIQKEDIMIIEEINEEDDVLYISNYRCWGFDFISALGALSVLLIVGDTWCAITDPLRYHSRISELKAWFLIAATWFLSILFGIASAFRYELPMSNLNNVGVIRNSNTNNQITIMYNTTSNKLASPTTDHEFMVNNAAMPSNDLYNLLFACIYFIVIIMLPICLVCGMYWKIFSEAKQNGLRMRQNGSSPLLQSALNLAAASAAAANCPAPPASIVPHQGGLTMKIDKHLNNNNNNSHHMGKESYRPLLITPTHQRRYLEIPKDEPKDRNDNTLVLNASQQTSDSDDQSLHQHNNNHHQQQQQQMRRNVSARHLMMLEQADLKSSVRHTHSSPNLHKSFDQLSQNVPTMPIHSVNCHPQAHNQNHHHHHHQHHHHHHHHVPPKALSYMTSIRHRLSNASSIFKYREESRAARISILVVIMFLISYFPYGLLVLLHGRLSFITNSAALAVSFLMIANVSSPFLFAYRNKRVRRGVCRLFGIDPKTNQRLQKHRLLLGRNRSGTTIKIQRNSSKASTYSVNSTKYLTPQSAALLPPSSEKRSSCLTNNDRCSSRNALNGMSGSIMGNTTMIATRNCDKKIKFSLFKRMCDTSKKLGCAMDSSCTSNSSCQEVADV